MNNPYRKMLNEVISSGQLGHTARGILELRADAWDEGYKERDEEDKRRVEEIPYVLPG